MYLRNMPPKMRRAGDEIRLIWQRDKNSTQRHKGGMSMEDTRIIELYWQRNGTAIDETDKKYGQMYIELASYGHPGGVYFTAGTNHAIG